MFASSSQLYPLAYLRASVCNRILSFFGDEVAPLCPTTRQDPAPLFGLINESTTNTPRKGWHDNRRHERVVYFLHQDMFRCRPRAFAVVGLNLDNHGEGGNKERHFCISKNKPANRNTITHDGPGHGHNVSCMMPPNFWSNLGPCCGSWKRYLLDLDSTYSMPAGTGSPWTNMK
jgi:hypothetical protein